MTWLSDNIPAVTGLAGLIATFATLWKVAGDNRAGVRASAASREQAFNARVDERLKEVERQLDDVEDELEQERRARVVAERYAAQLVQVLIRNNLEVPDRPTA